MRSIDTVNSRSGAAAWLVAAAVLWCLSCAFSAAHAQAAAAGKRPLFQKYVGSPNSDGLLREPGVRSQLEALLGKALPKLRQNIEVAGDVDLVGGALRVSGNAPHKGTEEEGIICISDVGTAPLVEAAIFSKGRVTVFAKAEKYEYAMLCIKDWITQVNSMHRDRFDQPKNVQLVRAK